VSEIADNCQGVKLVLVALKCDLRESQPEEGEDAEAHDKEPKKEFIDYNTGLAVAKRIQALRYLGKSLLGEHTDVILT
jgi:Rho family, other